ncbi:hypothetical protein [Phytohabitans kaempferiae]|uniref:Uncharacterized protein n=1 Tax=Phytohabitans kaempferiae TaxID=1620943 RepID=A0ABV6MF24_9ACTN
MRTTTRYFDGPGGDLMAPPSSTRTWGAAVVSRALSKKDTALWTNIKPLGLYLMVSAAVLCGGTLASHEQPHWPCNGTAMPHEGQISERGCTTGSARPRRRPALRG